MSIGTALPKVWDNELTEGAVCRPEPYEVKGRQKWKTRTSFECTYVL